MTALFKPGSQVKFLRPVLLNTIPALSTLYAPQPLLPVISQQFSVGRGRPRH
ncbi:MAG: hypothetical protein IMY82_06950 [Chloroflexi bacterium]|nr:hypothetical protein [Chloroflexota bacterium]